MHTFIIEMLECPICHQPLSWDIDEENNIHIEQAEARCSGCEAIYPVRDGIGIFLTPDLPRNDLWELVESNLTNHLNEHPELERQLMDSPIEELSPTDQQFRAMVLDEHGNFEESRKAEKLASENMYTPEYRSGWKSQVDFTLEKLSALEGPVVDIASGRCYLVEKVASQLQRPVIASDFSPNVLRRDRKLFQFLGLDDLVSFLAFDARRTPFRNGAIKVMTTNLGLPNIENPGELLSELHRVVDGTFLAISHFFPTKDEENRAVIKDAGLEELLYKESALKEFSSAGWEATLENAFLAKALPTPPSKIIEGARADGLPVAPTEMEWGVIRATHQGAS